MVYTAICVKCRTIFDTLYMSYKLCFFNRKNSAYSSKCKQFEVKYAKSKRVYANMSNFMQNLSGFIQK